MQQGRRVDDYFREWARKFGFKMAVGMFTPSLSHSSILRRLSSSPTPIFHR